MAIAVPFLLSAAGVSTTTALITSVAFAVTGINDKINKVASKVFGEDLVKVGNLLGAAYGAINGGFDLPNFGGDAAGVASAAAGGAEAASSAVDAYGAGSGWGGDTLSAMGMDGAAASASPAAAAATAPPAFESGMRNLLTESAGNLEAGNVIDSMQAAAPAENAVSRTAAFEAPTPAPQPAAVSATDARATQSVADTAAGQRAAAPISAPQEAFRRTEIATRNATEPRNVFQRLGMTDSSGNLTQTGMRIGGQALQGGAQAYGSAKDRALRQRQYDEQVRRANQGSGVRLTR